MSDSDSLRNWLLVLTALYLLALAAVTAINHVGADRFWFGALNLYLPQLMWALPGIALTILFFKVQRSLCWLPLLCTVWALGPVMGFKLSLTSADAASDAPRVRVMTWNIKYGYYSLAPLIVELSRVNPDVVLFQDAAGAMSGALRGYFRGWQIRSRGQYVIASKYPLSEAEVVTLPSFGEGNEFCFRCVMNVDGRTVTLYNVHLKTPRRSLNAFRTARKDPWYLPEAIARFDHNVATRLLQSRVLAEELKRESGPVILAGDLNSPDASLACATLREAGLHDSFAERGTGYGFSYGQLLLKYRLPWLRLSWMRIDHIMTTSSFVTERCWSGTGNASDHRPVVADLLLKNSH